MKKRIASVITLIAFWTTSVFSMPISAADTAPLDEVELILQNMLDVNVVDENGTTITGIGMSLVDENGVEVATWTTGEPNVRMANSSYISGVSRSGTYEIYMAKLLEAAKSLIGDKEIFSLKNGTMELWVPGMGIHNAIYCRPGEKTEYMVRYFGDYATALTVEGGKVVTVVDARSDDGRISIYDAADLRPVKDLKIADIKGTNTFEMTPGEYNLEGLDMSVSDTAKEYIKLRLKLSDTFGSQYFSEQGAFKHDNFGEVSFPSNTADVTSVLTFCSGSVITVACPDSEGCVEVYVEKSARRLGIDASFSSDVGSGGGFGLTSMKTAYDQKSFIGNVVELSTTGTLLYYVPAGNYTVKMLRTPSGYQPKDPVTVSVVDSREVQKLSIELEAIHTHAYGTEYKTDATNHWKECACGQKDSVETHVPGPEATETSAQVCTICGYELAPIKDHVHEYSTEYKTDATNHWKECACGQKDSVEAHVPGPEATETSAQVCTVCGYELAPIKDHVHEYSTEYKTDATNHWKECVCGQKDSVEAHVPGPEATETSAQVCTVCGYELAPKKDHVHEYSTEYKTDADSHWKECACGEKAEMAEHTYIWVIDKEATGTQEGSKREVCSVCGYEKQTVTIPVVAAPETGDRSNVPLLFALAAAALALFAGAAVYGKKRIYNQD